MHEPITAVSAAALIDQTLGHQERVTLVDSPAVFAGIKSFEPGEVFGNHYHEGYDEFFAVVSGELVVWQGRATRVVLRAGSSLLCARGSHHMLVNESESRATLMYVKVPLVADDTHWVEWTPSAS
jgi:quercetin dioxygenase-like cupin family protein